jgi:hypothetical protein
VIDPNLHTEDLSRGATIARVDPMAELERQAQGFAQPLVRRSCDDRLTDLDALETASSLSDSVCHRRRMSGP